MNIRNSYLALSFAAAAVAAPLQAASPQKIFTDLAQNPASAPLVPTSRERALPALAALTSEVDAVLALRKAGSWLKNIDDDPETKALLSAVDNLVICSGKGSDASLEAFLSAILSGVSSQQIKEMAIWKSAANESAGSIIGKVFSQLADAYAAKGIDQAKQMHLAPVYVVLTAEAGKEASMAELFAMVSESIQDDELWQAAEWQGFTGVRTTQDKLVEQIFQSDNEPLTQARKALYKELATRDLFFLMKQENGVLIFTICEKTDDLRFPANPAQSLLHSPILAGADAHLDTLCASGWLSPQMTQVMGKVSRYNAQAEAIVTVFETLAAADAANSGVYRAAAQGMALISLKVFPHYPDLTKPTTLQVWSKGKDFFIDATSDSMGATFQPGELHLSDAAADSSTIFYTEFTPFSSPQSPNLTGTLAAAYDVAKGYVLTLPEEEQDRIAPQMTIAHALIPDLLNLGQAIQTATSGLSMPCALLVGDTDSNSALPGIALYAKVKDRAMLAQGWDQMLAAINEAGMKFGMPNAGAMIPLIPTPQENDGVNYKLALPVPFGVVPQLTLNHERFILGTSSSLNEQLYSRRINAVPFCGSAIALYVPALQNYLIRIGEKNAAFNSFCKNVQALYLVHRIQDGTSIVRILVKKV